MGGSKVNLPDDLFSPRLTIPSEPFASGKCLGCFPAALSFYLTGSLNMNTNMQWKPTELLAKESEDLNTKAIETRCKGGEWLIRSISHIPMFTSGVFLLDKSGRRPLLPGKMFKLMLWSTKFESRMFTFLFLPLHPEHA
ncbi:hypothetical protein Fmac_012480 [Flemingia macrophylla]|uniref:Uncharacterized protein n=1 Tax=Flemingia macrophylla TaxID=520843 RepID=A0ABD1MQF2_9FABA